MKKILLQGSLTFLVFFFSWFLLSKLDWRSMFAVEQTTDKTEEKLGELFWTLIKESEEVIDDPRVLSTVDSMVSKICLNNDIPVTEVKIHVVEKDEINAFAMPGGHIVVYSGLILEASNPDEVCGVLAHEIAHLRLNHVMKKLVNEFGLSILVSMTAGGAGSEAMKEAAQSLSSSAFDRSLEQEADLQAVEYLSKAHINPEGLANFLYKITSPDNTLNKYLSWVSTHPDSKERAEYIVMHSKNFTLQAEPIITLDSWNKLKERLQDR